MSDSPQLRQHREDSRKTQADIARILSEITGQNVNQSQVSRWEDDPETIPNRMMRPLAQALGVTTDDLYEAPSKRDHMIVDPGAPYAQVRKNVDLLQACLESVSKDPPPVGVPSPKQVEDLARRLRRKPTVVVAGHFDAGKSRLCNALLGDSKLPASYRPTTAANTWLRHIEDRPAWCTEEVYIFRQGFDPNKLDNEEHGRSFLVASGSIEMLATYATHKGGRSAAGEYTAFVFLDAPLLRACTLVDLPGHQHDEKDAKLAAAAIGMADVLIYLSNSTGFLDGQDLAHLRAHLRALPLLERYGLAPLENLVIVASHAHPNISDTDLAEILRDGCATLVRELKETVFTERADRSGRPITSDHVKARIFPFWFERADRRDGLREAIRLMLSERVPTAWLKNADEEVEAFRTASRGACDDNIAQYRRALEDIEAARGDLDRRLAVEPARRAERERVAEQIRQSIHAAWRESRAGVSGRYAAIAGVENVERVIRQRYRNDKKMAQQHAPGAIIDLLQADLAADATRRADALTTRIEAYLGFFGSLNGTIPRPDGSSGVTIAFDARGAFLGGLAGLGTLGALSAWAASLGNLGGYIIVAKVASLLSALGISVGSSALVSLVAALGGPATWAIGVAVALFGLVSSLFGESWERRLAKKVVEVLESQRVCAQFEAGVDNYWNQTLRGFNQASASVESDYQSQLAHLRAVIEEGARNKAQLETLLATIHRIRDFFAGLPWRPVGAPAT